MGTITAMGDDRSRLRLLTWLSPSFPVGAFGYSHGLEQAIREGPVHDGQTLFDWLCDLVRHGSGWTDTVLLNEAHEAVRCDDAPRLRAVAELAVALAPSAERRRETLQQGQAFLTALSIGWPSDILAALEPTTPYCVAVGAASAAHGIEPLDAATAFLHAFVSNLVAVALRAAGLGQSVGVGVLARLEPTIVATARSAADSTLDDLGSATVMSDIMSMRHETLDGRLFIS